MRSDEDIAVPVTIPESLRDLSDRPLRVLMVEDSAADAELCMRAVRQAGLKAEFDTAEDETAFRRRLQESKYDVILSDNSLPRWSGQEALKLAKAIAPDIPFLLVTGSLGEEAAVDVIKRGAVDYIIKDRMTRLPDAILRAIADRRAVKDRERTLQALRASEKRLRAMIDHEPGCVKLIDAENRLLEINAAGLRIMETDSTAALLGKPILDVVVPEHRDAFAELTRRVISGQPTSLEFEVFTLKGARRRLESHAVPFETDGRTIVLAITRDVTDQRLLEKRISHLEKFEAIGQLAGGIAHDFNNLLGAILGWAELGLENAERPELVREHFREIHQQGTRAAMLTRQLLAFARRQVLEPRNLDLNQTISDLRPLLEKLLGAEVELNFVLAPELTVVRADAAQVEQILMNLCVNARDAMPDGGKLSISTTETAIDEEYQRQHPYARQGHYVRLVVADTGTGMDAATQERIFEPFFSTKGEGHGTGLGLATVYGIVRQHGGFIHVYSEVGHGTEFSIYLPASEGRPERLRAETKSESVRGTETILIAEDHEGLRTMAKVTLTMLGYRPIVVADGEEALKVFRERSKEIDVVILDVVMPRLNGPEAYRKMCELRPDVPVIFSSGYAAESPLLKDLIETGKVSMLQKPFRVSTLGAKIREVLRSAGRA